MSALEFTPLPLPGLTLVRPRHQADRRGQFAKPYQASAFAQAGLRADWAETYHSLSLPGVIRGMHYQRPPHHHAKLVWCVQGRVIDVALDLRPGPGFGLYHTLELSAENGLALYLPPGLAHGFCVPAGAEPAIVLYQVTSEYAPEADTGVRFDSFGFTWPAPTPILSDRDLAFDVLEAHRGAFAI